MVSQHCREEMKDEGMNPIADPKIVIRLKCNNYWKGFSLRPKIDGQRPKGQVIANRLPELERNKLELAQWSFKIIF